MNIPTLIENIICHNDSGYRKSIMTIFKRNFMIFVIYFKVNFKDENHGKLGRNILDCLLD